MKVKEVLTIGICSFCECVLQEQLIGKKEFKRSVENFINTEENLEGSLNDFSHEYDFDKGFIDNAIKEYNINYKEIDYTMAYNCIIESFKDTIYERRTIEVGAYMNILLQIILEHI